MKTASEASGSIPPAASRRQLATVKKLDGAARHTDYRLDMENHFNGYLAPRLVAVWGNTKVTTTCRTREVWAPSGRGRCRGPSVSPYLPPSSPPPLCLENLVKTARRETVPSLLLASSHCQKLFE